MSFETQNQILLAKKLRNALRKNAHLKDLVAMLIHAIIISNWYSHDNNKPGSR